MTVIQRCKQKGLTLLETVLALAVGMVIVMAVLIYFQTASDSANMAATIKITGDIGNAVRAYAQSPSYKGNTIINLSDLQAAGLLTTSDTVNPWSIQPGALKVGTSGNYLGINFYNVPAQVNTTSKTKNQAGGICASLAMQLSNALPMPSPGTVTLLGVKHTYNYTISRPATGGGITVVTEDKSGKVLNTQTAQGAAVCQYTKGQSTGILSIVMDLT